LWCDIFRFHIFRAIYKERKINEKAVSKEIIFSTSGKDTWFLIDDFLEILTISNSFDESLLQMLRTHFLFNQIT